MLGLTFQQVQKYEKGTNRMSASVLHTLAEKMKVDIGYFFEGLGTEGGTTVIQPASKAAIEIMDVVERMEPRQQRLLASLARELAPAEQQAA